MEDDDIIKLNHLVATSTAGESESADMSDALNTLHLTVEFIPGISSATNTDISDLKLSNSDGETIITVEFERMCAPENPLYLRWVNDLGGFEYQMFDQYKEYGTEAAGIVDFSPAVDSTEDGWRTREVINLTGAKRTITAGLEQLTRDDFDLVASVSLSPRIDMWDVVTGKWLGVTLDGNTKTTWDTRTLRGAIELTLRLGVLQLQF
jgi:hypothetical protein